MKAKVQKSAAEAREQRVRIAKGMIASFRMENITISEERAMEILRKIEAKLEKQNQ